ncbi:FAD-binding oxidoreductase [Sorangium sp. So ce1335]|uniref:FAD-binding oxidoreductase n=1 Tax=Sorangium sp. So ce1335 TaxID=3133335 RepID=UPI003F60B948
MSPLDELALTLGDGLVTDRDVMDGYRHDQAIWAVGGWPRAVARPSSTADVQALARWATRHRVALVSRGAGTGVAGGATATEGCVVVSFERMNRILAIDEAAMLAVVQPGVLNGDLKAAARERGLWYPPDPSSYAVSTIGGNVATNAGGLCCVKYGVTADYVLGLEAVLADGTVVRTGGRSRKDVAGYDLTRLLVGSEGTLAMITEITLRLRRLPPPSTTLVATFGSLEASGRAVAAIVRAVDASLLEIMDRTALRAVESHARLDLDTEAAAMLIAQSDAHGSAELGRMNEACEEAGATMIATTDDEGEGQMLLTARRLALPALQRLGTVLVDDVAVPLPLLPEMFRRIEVIVAESETVIGTVAHAGDGNLHPLVVFDRGDAAAEARAVAAFEAVMAQAIDLGGTITGEHGVGTLKRGFLTRQLGAASLALHHRIKDAFDPGGILNPGKVIAPPGATRAGG